MKKLSLTDKNRTWIKNEDLIQLVRLGAVTVNAFSVRDRMANLTIIGELTEDGRLVPTKVTRRNLQVTAWRPSSEVK